MFLLRLDQFLVMRLGTDYVELARILGLVEAALVVDVGASYRAELRVLLLL